MAKTRVKIPVTVHHFDGGHAIVIDPSQMSAPEKKPEIAMMGVVPLDIALAAMGGDREALDQAKTFMSPALPQTDFAKRLGDLGVTFHGVPTPRVEVLETIDERARDAFVKIAPRILASARETFDGAAAMKAARDAGALGSVLAPVYIRETQKAAPSSRGLTAREAVTRWFDAQRGMSAEDREDAEMAVHLFLDKEGM